MFLLLDLLGSSVLLRHRRWNALLSLGRWRGRGNVRTGNRNRSVGHRGCGRPRGWCCLRLPGRLAFYRGGAIAKVAEDSRLGIPWAWAAPVRHRVRRMVCSLEDSDC